MSNESRRKKPNREELDKLYADFDYSLNLASECLTMHASTGDVVGVDLDDGSTRFLRLESVLDADDPVSAEMFANHQALILFFNGLTAHALQRSIEVGIPEELAAERHKDVRTIVVNSMCDIQPKHLTARGRFRWNSLLYLARVATIFNLHDGKSSQDT